MFAYNNWKAIKKICMYNPIWRNIKKLYNKNKKYKKYNIIR